jgi:hypothetical protein
MIICSLYTFRLQCRTIRKDHLYQSSGPQFSAIIGNTINRSNYDSKLSKNHKNIINKIQRLIIIY